MTLAEDWVKSPPVLTFLGVVASRYRSPAPASPAHKSNVIGIRAGAISNPE